MDSRRYMAAGRALVAVVLVAGLVAPTVGAAAVAAQENGGADLSRSMVLEWARNSEDVTVSTARDVRGWVANNPSEFTPSELEIVADWLSRELPSETVTKADLQNGGEGAASGDGNNSSETEEYTFEGLTRQISHDGAPPSVRRWGDMGQIWVRHIPVGLFATNDPETSGRYIRPRTEVQRKSVYVGSYRGWDAPELNLSVQIVLWNRGTEVRNVSGQRQTVTVPKNVTTSTAEVTLSGNGYDRAEVSLPTSYDRSKRVTMWVEGHRETTQWTYRLQTSKAAENIPIGSLGGVIKWSILNVWLWTVLVAGGLVVVDRALLAKAGKGPQWGILEYGFLGFAALFFGGLVFYSGVMNTLARRPQLIGVLGGVFLGGIVLYAMSDDAEEALFLQPTGLTNSVDTDGSGNWHWANEVHSVVEREKDGKKVIPRSGWLPFFASIWPGYDARPVLEFDADAERKLIPPRSEEQQFPEEDVSRWDRIRTALTGGAGSEHEYDTIYLIDPLADDVVTHEREGFEWAFPTLVEWPEDEDSGTWIKGTPLPSIAFGKIVAGVGVVALVTGGVTMGTASLGWGSLAGVVALLALVARPVEGSATATLAPAHFDSVLANVVTTLEGYSERADAEYFRMKYHEADARRRVERTEDRERDETTVFGQINERLAPDTVSSGEAASEPQRRESARKGAQGDAGASDD
ncbi:hypothetical protein [Halolamina sp.]|uniref:hypothetical protein n=1 Tax=Halolamina sp. TaxID=1940283 RepID=UPI0035690DC1